MNPATGEVVTVESLLTFDGAVWMLTSFCDNIIKFPTIVLGLVVALGVGLFEVTGMASALMRASVVKAPDKILIPLLLLISVSSNIAGDAGFIVMPMIGAIVFQAKGKSPIALCGCRRGLLCESSRESHRCHPYRVHRCCGKDH